MKIITLTRGKVALVDDADFKWLSEMGKWQVHNVKRGEREIYAAMTKRIGRKKLTLLMHRVILDLPRGVLADHKDGNGLNNQRSNIRPATSAQNAANRRKSIRNTSGFIGVHPHKRTGKWEVTVKHKYVGLFETKQAAAAAYNAFAKRTYGDFAPLNPVTK